MNPSDLEIAKFNSIKRNWFFTFGMDHGYANCYIKIKGTIISSRNTMQRLFGSKWAFQYPSEEAAGVKKWNLKEININDIPHLRENKI